MLVGADTRILESAIGLANEFVFREFGSQQGAKRCGLIAVAHSDACKISLPILVMLAHLPRPHSKTYGLAIVASHSWAMNSHEYSIPPMNMTDIHGWATSWWARHARLVNILDILYIYSTSLKI